MANPLPIGDASCRLESIEPATTVRHCKSQRHGDRGAAPAFPRLAAAGLLLAHGWALAATLPNVPEAHPRLWLSTPALRAAAAEWLSAAGTQPAPGDHAGNAFVAVLTNDAARCTAAVNWLVGFTLPDIGNVSSDNARWYGESAALVFDWCHFAMTPAQRSQVIMRWNGYLDTLHAKPWGGRGFAENNYFWGYLRNNIEWALATWHENPQAPALLQAAVDVRFDTWFLAEHAATLGAGGVPGEGTQYGRYMLGYPVVPFLTLRDYGLDLYRRAPYFGAAIYYLRYSTLPQRTPAPPASPQCDARYWYQTPFNDDETFLQCEPEAVRGVDNGLFMLAMSEAGIGAQRDHARQWFAQAQPVLPFWARFRLPAAPGTGIEPLPLDYFAPGPGFLWARSGHGADDAVVLLQLAAHGNVGHRHNDTGTFQFWHAGEWISRETTGYTDRIPGYANGTDVDVLETVGHNGVLFEGRGERGWTSGGPRDIPPGVPRGQEPDGLARVIRVHHAPAFLYAAVDLSKPYRAEHSNDPCRYDWPFAESAVREFLFVRAMHVLVVLDRLQSGSDSLGYTNGYCQTVGFTNYSGPRLASDAVRKTFLAHFPGPVTVSGAVATGQAGTQTVRVETVLSAVVTRRVVDERFGNPISVGQFRLEVDASGQPLTHFLHTVQAVSPGGSVVVASIDTTATPWQLRLQQAGQSDVAVDIVPGAGSTGGAVRVGAQHTVLLERVQQSWVDATGPHWELPDDRIFADGFGG
ncbi:MAG: hypothetical protein AMXMBFR59_23450 [Rhodanobacteraceae bacterium]